MNFRGNLLAYRILTALLVAECRLRIALENDRGR